MTPFSGLYTSQVAAPNNVNRLKQFRSFCGLNDFEGVHSLDIGFRSYISTQLRVEHQTKGDLNEGVISEGKDYDVVVCLETLQHTMNPLNVLRGIKSKMKTGGKLFLSTPVPRLAWMRHRGNFVEFPLENLRVLLEYVGFKIKREKIYCPWPISFAVMGFLQPLRWFRPVIKGDPIHHPGAPRAKWYFFGLRPIARLLHDRYILLEAEKI